MVELMKSPLHGNHDNYSTTKCFFAISCKNVVKITQFQMLPESTIFNVKNPKLCEVIDLSLLILKIKFLWGWACQILGIEGQEENRDKTGKMLNFPGL